MTPTEHAEILNALSTLAAQHRAETAAKIAAMPSVTALVNRVTGEIKFSRELTNAEVASQEWVLDLAQTRAYRRR